MLVIVEVGHGAGDPGTLGGPLPPTEETVLTDVARALAAFSGAGIIYALKRRYPRALGGLGRLLSEWRLRKKKADVVLSIHMDSAGPIRRGLAVYYWKDDPIWTRREGSLLLAKCLADCAAGVVKTAPYLRAGGQWFLPGVLRNTAQRAAVLVEIDNLANPQVEQDTMDSRWAGRQAARLDAAVRIWADAQ